MGKLHAKFPIYCEATKNDEGQTVSIFLPYVFLNKDDADKVRRFDKAWNKACEDAGIGVKLFHDFRSTGVRNMARSGTPERVAMMIAGYKTRSVLDTYDIGNHTDSRLAA